ncbi:MAG: efflux RND transporter periplasmic adaptor subunit [Xanthobacteraceae bacterium]|nr:efflux RND transporter periplasmic adaptor subunit [Xanthobacteraceae bacterium]
MRFRIRLASALAPLAVALAACGQSQQPAAPPPPTVTVAKPAQRTVTDLDEYVGRFVAIDSVEIRARVSGYLDQVHFRDGQMVKQGDLLFSIDKRPFENMLAQTRGTLAQAKANLAFTEADLERARQLVRERTITEQAFDQRTQAFRSAQASVAANEALVRQAALDVEFTELRAPVAGRIGDRRVSPGNLVAGGSIPTTTLLATIVSLDPIRFEFTMDEASYLRYERLAQNSKEVTGREANVKVGLKLLDEKGFERTGNLDFVDNVIERSSGTIRGRAVFANPTGVLTPGMFGRIRVPGSASYNALLVPDAAVGTEQVRKFVLVIGTDNVAAAKYVTLGGLTEDNLRIIKDGLGPDDRVVVNGLMRVRPGQKVTPQEQGAAPSASGPQAKG